MSSYLVLARKYRPKVFSEVIGQDVVTEVLRGALKGGHLGHAYLFAGPRGTGKTTLARIFARCLNCEQGPTPDPCGTCERCLGADAGSEVDVIELDAASHTGVENIRELRDEVAYAPMRARYKVYIVDEVHMLSKPAFNALLKTLEEPPAHVIFLFATTDPHKVLDTVLSRCQILRLSSLSVERIGARLEHVFHAEGVRAEDGVVRELARRARGGMRDALSQADKLLALSGDSPTLEDLRRLGGEVGSEEVETLLERVEAGDRPGILEHLRRLEGDEEELGIALLEHVRASAVLAWCGEASPHVALAGDARTRAAERGRRLGAARLELWMQELLRARERMRLLAGQEHVVLELCLLDLAREEHTLPLAELVARLEALERPGQKPTAAAPATPAAARAPAVAERSPARHEAAPTPAPSARPEPAGWERFLAELRRGHASLADVLARRTAGALTEDASGALRVRLADLSAEELRILGDRRNQKTCSEVGARVLGRPLALDLAASSPAAVPSERPARDGLTQRVIQEFDGRAEDL